MKRKEDMVIPYIYPANYHLSPFEDGYGYDPYVGQMGVMQDAIGKSLSDDEERWMI